MFILTAMTWFALRYRFRELPGSRFAASVPLTVVWVSSAAFLAALLVAITPLDSMVDVFLLAAAVGWLATLAVASWPARWTLPRHSLPAIAELEALKTRRVFKARAEAISAELSILADDFDRSPGRVERIRDAISNVIGK